MKLAAKTTTARQTATRFTLAPADFYKLVSQTRLVEIVKLEARDKAAKLAIEIVQKEIASVDGHRKALFDTLAAKYGFDPTRAYQIDEDTCTLIAVSVPPSS